MLSLPITLLSVIAIFAPVFSWSVWLHAKVLITGAILAPGTRTVTSILRIMGHAEDPHCQNDHRVLNRAVWSPLKASRLLLRLLIAIFVPWGPVVVGLDETLERRRGYVWMQRSMTHRPSADSVRKADLDSKAIGVPPGQPSSTIRRPSGRR